MAEETIEWVGKSGDVKVYLSGFLPQPLQLQHPVATASELYTPLQTLLKQNQWTAMACNRLSQHWYENGKLVATASIIPHLSQKC